MEKQTELLKQVLEDKEKEISDTKNQFRQAKEKAIREYRDSDTFLAELGGSFAEGFDDALSQVKSSYPDLDVSHVNIDAQAQTSVHLAHSKSTDRLFADDAFVDGPHGDGGLLLKAKSKPSRSAPVNLKIKFWTTMTLPFSISLFFFFFF